MKKSVFRNYQFGSAEYVTLHAQWKMGRGKNPSLPFGNEKNPRKALAEAERLANFSTKRQSSRKDVTMYEVIISLKTIGEYESFKEAIFKFFREIKAILDRGASWQWLETMNFLVRTSPNDSIEVMPFYEARDFAIDIGLLKNGETQSDAEEPAPEVVLRAYNDCMESMEYAQRQELFAMIRQLHEKMVGLSDKLRGELMPAN